MTKTSLAILFCILPLTFKLSVAAAHEEHADHAAHGAKKTTDAKANEAGDLKIVKNDNVCMVTDNHFGKKQIPITVEGKTYYGCCENCKGTLGKDPTVRTAIDPVSGKKVDKAKAVIGARADDSVVYFENKANFEKYAATPKAPSTLAK